MKKGKLLRLKKGNEQGFTFLELLLVLSVVSILTAIIIPVGKKWIRTTSEEDAIQGLVSTIHGIQSYAIAHGVSTWIEFNQSNGRTEYVARAPGGIVFSRTYLPDGMNLSDYSYLRSVEFHSDGDIIKLGTMALETKSGIIRIRFQFQRGRMIIGE